MGTSYLVNDLWRRVQELEQAAQALSPWHPLPPRDTWLRTRREGEDGENICMLASFNNEEWIERDGGRTTVTHHSFAPPTEWSYLPAPAAEVIGIKEA